MLLVWTDFADTDLESIETYIAHNNPVVAIDVVLDIINAVETILPEHQQRKF